MESQYQKWVNLSYLAIAALLAFVLFTFGVKLSATYDLETRYKDIDTAIRIGSIVIGAIGFYVLSKNPTANTFMNEVVTELARVTWPTQKETSSATVVVIIMVIISGIILGFLDYVWTQAIAWIMR